MSLTTVPTAKFNNGVENELTFSFYNGTVSISQKGDYDDPENISIDEAEFESFIKALRSAYKESVNWKEFLETNKIIKQ